MQLQPKLPSKYRCKMTPFSFVVSTDASAFASDAATTAALSTLGYSRCRICLLTDEYGVFTSSSRDCGGGRTQPLQPLPAITGCRVGMPSNLVFPPNVVSKAMYAVFLQLERLAAFSIFLAAVACTHCCLQMAKQPLRILKVRQVAHMQT